MCNALRIVLVMMGLMSVSFAQAHKKTISGGRPLQGEVEGDFMSDTSIGSVHANISPDLDIFKHGVSGYTRTKAPVPIFQFTYGNNEQVAGFDIPNELNVVDNHQCGLITDVKQYTSVDQYRIEEAEKFAGDDGSAYLMGGEEGVRTLEKMSHVHEDPSTSPAQDSVTSQAFTVSEVKCLTSTVTRSPSPVELHPLFLSKLLELVPSAGDVKMDTEIGDLTGDESSANSNSGPASAAVGEQNEQEGNGDLDTFESSEDMDDLETPAESGEFLLIDGATGHNEKVLEVLNDIGTHYYERAHLGGRLRQVLLGNVPIDKAEIQLRHEINAKPMGTPDATLTSSQVIVDGGNTGFFTDDTAYYREWVETVNHRPDVIGGKLRPITELIERIDSFSGPPHLLRQVEAKKTEIGKVLENGLVLLKDHYQRPYKRAQTLSAPSS